MYTVGIICECNPFHGGHEYLIRKARQAGADCVIAVMSGSFVQRGEPAAAEAYLRAKAVLLGGADLVLELPFPYSSAPAEFFAAAGVEILSSLGANELWFGSECGDIEFLSHLARVSDSAEFQVLYAQSVTESCGTAKAYLDCLSRLCGRALSLSSNDLLGIAYLRAIAKKGTEMRPVTVKRKGSGYLETQLGNGYPSATALRKTWREGGVESIMAYLPAAVHEVYAECRQPYDLSCAERLILGYFRLTPIEHFESIAELSGGLGARLKKAACESATLSELLERAATKKYTNARLLRGILFALTGITEADLRQKPAYTHLLAANDKGCSFLKKKRKNDAIAIVTRRTDLPNTKEAQKQAEIEERAQQLYALCSPSATSSASLWEKSPCVLKKFE